MSPYLAPYNLECGRPVALAVAANESTHDRLKLLLARHHDRATDKVNQLAIVPAVFVQHLLHAAALRLDRSQRESLEDEPRPLVLVWAMDLGLDGTSDGTHVLGADTAVVAAVMAAAAAAVAVR